MTLKLYNTLSRKKDEFTPIDAKNVRMYVCGPTVYDRPHLGNARSVVVYDVLYRLLKHIYGDTHVTYVRNITDVDDKINAAAKANGEPISALTKRIEGFFHEDMAALNCQLPTKEPHATAHIKQMVVMIEKLIANGHAYVSEGHVLFSVSSYKNYGALSGRKLEDLIAGARVEVESYKREAGDFVLWKPAEEGDDPSSVFPSPWGAGRPGWHIECSAMSMEYLSDERFQENDPKRYHFDIHGGGADLMFPHHENEIAQSCCAAPASKFANYWVHNGFLTVNGEKMSKSLGNFTTVKDLLDKGVKGEVIRLALLSANCRGPLDWNQNLLSSTKSVLDGWYRKWAELLKFGDDYEAYTNHIGEAVIGYSMLQKDNFFNACLDDLNISAALSCMHVCEPATLVTLGKFLGLFTVTPEEWFKGDINNDAVSTIQSLIDARIAAKKDKNWAEADRIRKELSDQGIILEDKPDGTTDWRRA